MSQVVQRTTWMSALIAAPALAAAIGLSAIEGYRLARPLSPLFGEPPPASLADAITRRVGVEHAYAFIRRGQDPNAPIIVDDPDYTGGRPLNVSPLMLAVAARDSGVVLMLLNFGARLDLPQNRFAGCLGQELEDEVIANIIAREGGLHGAACPQRGAGATPPLLAWQ
jgi:hypothetical protein